MFTGNCLSMTPLTEEKKEFSTLFEKEQVVEVEIPVRGLMIKESVVISRHSQGQIEAQSSNISHFCTGSFNYPLFIKLGSSNKILMCRLSDLLVYSGKLILSDFQLVDPNLD